MCCMSEFDVVFQVTTGAVSGVCQKQLTIDAMHNWRSNLEEYSNALNSSCLRVSDKICDYL